MYLTLVFFLAASRRRENNFLKESLCNVACLRFESFPEVEPAKGAGGAAHVPARGFLGVMLWPGEAKPQGSPPQICTGPELLPSTPIP